MQVFMVLLLFLFSLPYLLLLFFHYHIYHLAPLCFYSHVVQRSPSQRSISQLLHLNFQPSPTKIPPPFWSPTKIPPPFWLYLCMFVFIYILLLYGLFCLLSHISSVEPGLSICLAPCSLCVCRSVPHAERVLSKQLGDAFDATLGASCVAPATLKSVPLIGLWPRDTSSAR